MLFFITQSLFKLTSDSNKKTKKSEKYSLDCNFQCKLLTCATFSPYWLNISSYKDSKPPWPTAAHARESIYGWNIRGYASCKWFRLSKLTLFVNTINLSSFNSISAKILELKVLFCEVKHEVLHVSSIYLLLMKRNILVQIKLFTYLTFIQQFPKISSPINSFTIFNKIALFTTWEWNAYMKPIKNQNLLKNLTTCNE